jgi:3-deoxy-manno-octulosonate cytidylyltransferase (CMP-KDO synthetase)
MKRKSLGIIPARYASSRFPGKPLVELGGKSMIRRVYERALLSDVSKVVVATDDERIYEHVASFGGNVTMTSPAHESGSDRCAEAAEQYTDFEYIVNIQGDEPFIRPEQINLALSVFAKDSRFDIATLAKPITTAQELFNPNVVKAVFAPNGRALYFSRHPIPYLRNVPEDAWLEQNKHFKHIGLYVYKRNALKKLALLPVSDLERAESLEQLRWLENGIHIGLAVTPFDTVGVDTPEDLERATTLFL